ncbi:MAG: hypothetical protein NT069_07355 [Planctomycetota bacterium]|nr:hypothetical protein [Planctomycetota bacterium]
MVMISWLGADAFCKWLKSEIYQQSRARSNRLIDARRLRARLRASIDLSAE